LETGIIKSGKTSEKAGRMAKGDSRREEAREHLNYQIAYGESFKNYRGKGGSNGRFQKKRGRGGERKNQMNGEKDKDPQGAMTTSWSEG